MSTQPGATNSSSALTSRRASPAFRSTAVMVPSSIAISTWRWGAPVPSITVPLRITKSCIAVPFHGLSLPFQPSGCRPAGEIAPRSSLADKVENNPQCEQDWSPVMHGDEEKRILALDDELFSRLLVDHG